MVQVHCLLQLNIHPFCSLVVVVSSFLLFRCAQDHVGAVLSVGFSPTGREFVSGGYDRMVRIWNCNTGRSREVYHTKRMGRVFCSNFSQVTCECL